MIDEHAGQTVAGYSHKSDENEHQKHSWLARWTDSWSGRDKSRKSLGDKWMWAEEGLFISVISFAAK